MWYTHKKDTITLSVYVKPNAKKTAMIAITDESMHISLHAKPQDGEANKELITFLAKLFKTPKTQISIVRGEGSRHKQVSLPATQVLEQFLENPTIPLK